MTRVADIDSTWVAHQRRARVSWANIARMAGCSEAALKARFAPVGPAETVLVKPSTDPFERVKAALRARGVGETFAVIVARMWAAKGEMRLASALVRDLDIPNDSYLVVREARLSAQRRLGLLFATQRGSGTALTRESVAQLSDLAGVRP